MAGVFAAAFPVLDVHLAVNACCEEKWGGVLWCSLLEDLAPPLAAQFEVPPSALGGLERSPETAGGSGLTWFPCWGRSLFGLFQQGSLIAFRDLRGSS